MADLPSILNAELSSVASLIAAAGALGTAAYGLVDATKAIHGGVSNAGFRVIRARLTPLLDGPTGAALLGQGDGFATLYASWLNGVPKADQKAVAKSLVRLGLTPQRAPRLAAATGLDADLLAALARDVDAGNKLSEQQLGLLGRFDAIVSAVIDEVYERADQQYRNWAKLWAMLVSTALGIAGGAVIWAAQAQAAAQAAATAAAAVPAAAAQAAGTGAALAPAVAGATAGAATAATAAAGGSLCGYWFSSSFFLAALIGVIATPLAPIAKDLSSALQTAVKAVGAARR